MGMKMSPIIPRWYENVTDNSAVVCDGYVKYAEAEVDRSAIMIPEIMRKKQLKIIVIIV